MGPKKKETAVDYENLWRKIIEDTPLDDDNWSVKVIVMEAAGSDQDRIYLSKFETYAAEEKRFVIKNICKTETVFMINQLGSEKKVKDENLRVFEEGNSYLKEKKDIPPDLLALIIKHLILKMKDEYLFIKGQRLEVQDGTRKESATMVNKAEVRGAVSAVHAPVTDPQNKDLEKIGGKKFNTLLRERGEEWRDKVYVDDYPTDGPNLYVAVTGFVEPFLPGCLIKIGIPLTSVVQIRIDARNWQIPPSLSRATKRGQSQTELLADQSLKFWNNLQFLRIQEESSDDFKNTAFVVFSPPYWESDNLTGQPDRIYDELCCLMFDIQDLSRQHVHFLENMDIINIPEAKNDEESKIYYHKLIDDIPLECVTIYSVLDSILDTACKNVDLDVKSKSTSSVVVTLNTFSVPDNKYSKSENLVNNVFSTLCKIESNKKQYRLTYGEEYENHKDPTIIKYGDFVKYNTFHLGNLNLDQIVFSSLFGMPVHNLWLTQDRPSGELEAKVNFHVNVLLSCFNREDVETSELSRLLHLLACRKLYNNRSSLTKQHLQSTTITNFKKVYLKRSILAEPLPTCRSITQILDSSPTNFPSMTKISYESDVTSTSESNPEVERIKYLFDCPDISELVSAAEIANNQPIKHIIDEFEYFEDFSDVTAFQSMCQAFNKFNCVDYKYCEVTDCFILMFFNSHDKDGIAREEWRCHLSTPVCLQDFFDYILEEHHDWIQKEEKLYDENLLLKAQSESKDKIDPSVLISCIEDTEVDSDLLMEGSLKHQVLLQVAEANPEITESIDAQVASKGNNSPITVRDNNSSRKSRSPPIVSPKSVRQSFDLSPMVPSADEKKLSKAFLGYDLGDRRVEVFGKDATYFSRDGTKVSSMYSLIIPLNLEYINLNITTGNGYNEFSIHKVLGEVVKPEIIDFCESFRITSKNQVMINIKKQNYTVPINLSRTSSLDNVERKSQPKSVISTKINTLPIDFEKKHFHSLYLTWPNGMITETIYENNSSVLSHIKQHFVCQIPNLDEDMRCISLNGEVVVFKSSGDLEVLRPDGSFLKITKYYKKLVVPVSLDEVEDSSYKTKKSKSKGGKSSKVSSKSSRNIIADDEKVADDKNVQYELVIDEFETIETNGVRTHYVNDIPIYIEKLLIRTATDYCIGEIFSRRMDGTSTLLNKDGVLVVTFPNKTRIMTYFIIDDNEIYPEWTEEERQYLDLCEHEIETVKSKYSMSQRSFNGSNSGISKKIEEEEAKEKERSDGYILIHVIYTVEHFNFSTVTINKASEKISIDSPNATTVVIDKNNYYDLVLDEVTTASFDGENLKIFYEACPECKAFTTCNVKITSTDGSITSPSNNDWVNVKDSFGKNIVVNDEGSIVIVEDSSASDICSNEELSSQVPLSMLVQQDTELKTEEEVLGNFENTDDRVLDAKSENSMISHGKCREMYLAKTIRFFILRRELSCSELIHRALVEQYKSDCRWQPWCSVNQYNTFGDHRSVVSIITPVHLTESEKWYMESKLADKPKFLTYKDLKEDSGKGFYHWMRPYERFEPKPIKPENVLPPRLPRAYVLRTLEQQWGEAEREELKGAKELLEAILRYRAVMEKDSETLLNVPIMDPRPEEERRIDDIIQNLAHKIYEDLRDRLTEHVQHSAKSTITTKPVPPPSVDESVEAEQFGEENTTPSKVEEHQESLVKQLSQVEEMSPNLQKYWRRRTEELKEEEFYKYLLREGNVPPYFRNVLGGAIWWDMNYTAGEAVNKSERRKTMCVCAEDTVESDIEMTGREGYILPGPFQ